MANTKIVLKSRDLTDLGLPRKLGVYRLGDPRQIGPYFNVPVHVLDESELHVPRPPVQLAAQTAKAACELAILHYRGLAEHLRLEILISDLPE